MYISNFWPGWNTTHAFGQSTTLFEQSQVCVAGAARIAGTVVMAAARASSLLRSQLLTGAHTHTNLAYLLLLIYPLATFCLCTGVIIALGDVSMLYNNIEEHNYRLAFQHGTFFVFYYVR